MRYGQRVTVIALPSPPIFLTPAGLAYVGPRAFGYDFDFLLGVRRMIRLGIDVGGTNTDAVLVADGRILHTVKVPTTEDVTGGIVAAMRAVLAQADARVDAVMIGTTHFVNAVVQRRSLAPVAAIRVGLPATAGLPPFTDWPEDLAAPVAGGSWLVEGGHDYDGRRFMPLDIAAVRNAAREMRARGLTQVAVTAMFSPLTQEDEAAVATILRDEIAGSSVTCSHMLGGIGLLERENAAILNAAIIPLARETIGGFERAMRETGIAAPLYITQNDGTVAAASAGGAVPGVQLCLRPDQLDARRGVSVRVGRTPSLSMSAAQRPISAICRRAFPRQANTSVRGRRRAHLVPHAGRVVDRTGRRQPGRSGQHCVSGRAAWAIA